MILVGGVASPTARQPPCQYYPIYDLFLKFYKKLSYLCLKCKHLIIDKAILKLYNFIISTMKGELL